MRVLALLPALLIAGSALTHAAVPKAGRPAVTEFTLENGLQVVVIEDHRAPVVTHMIWYRVGSADERPGKTGIAHYLEHLMFKGTETMGPGEFSEVVAMNGGSDNAFTAQDYTAYHQRIARDRLGLMMRLEADRMANLRLTQRDVETEREVVLEERASRVGNNPGGRLDEQMSAALYLAHPYGHPIIGWEADIKGLDAEDAIAFYERFYTPSNAILVVAGDVTPQEVRRLAEDTYGSVENRTTVGPRVRPVEPPPEAARRVVLEDVRATPERLRRTYLVPAIARAEPGEAEALEVLGELLGSGSSSRLYRELVVEQRIAVDVSAYYSGTHYDLGEFTIDAAAAPDVDLRELEAAIDQVIAGIVADGPTDAEVARAKTAIIADEIYDRDSQSRMARGFGAALATGSSVEDVIAWPDRVREVTNGAVRAAAERWLVPERSVTGFLRQPATGERGRS